MNSALKWKLIAGFILAFVAGGITGAAVGGMHARHVFFEFHHPELIGVRMMEQLHRRPRPRDLDGSAPANSWESHRRTAAKTATNERAPPSVAPSARPARIFSRDVTDSVADHGGQSSGDAYRMLRTSPGLQSSLIHLDPRTR